LFATFVAVGIAAVPFSWENCGSTNDPIQIKSLSVAPSPIVFGKNITISFDIKLTQTITAATVDLLIEKKVIGWMNIPCVSNIGSCTYDDACAMMSELNITCPEEFVQNGIPCECPYPAGSYVLPSTTWGPIPLPPPILDWLTDGDYRVTVKMTDPNNGDARLGCYIVTLSLASK